MFVSPSVGIYYTKSYFYRDVVNVCRLNLTQALSCLTPTPTDYEFEAQILSFDECQSMDYHLLLVSHPMHRYFLVFV